MSPTFVKGIVFGILLVALWLQMGNLLLLGLYYLIAVQLMQMAGYFKG
jgi:hypothetical protein